MRNREGADMNMVSVRVKVGLVVVKWLCGTFFFTVQLEVSVQGHTSANPVSVVDVDHSADKVTSSLPFLPEDIHSFPSIFLG